VPAPPPAGVPAGSDFFKIGVSFSQTLQVFISTFVQILEKL